MSTTESYWQRDAGWADRWTRAALPASVDIVVIGGGYAGLMTAIRIREARPDASVLLLESERVGYGASGRNAGFLSPLAAPVWLLGAERSAEQAWAAARLNTAIHELAQWIREHVPDCELAPATLALAAGSSAADGALRELIDAVARVGLAHQVTGSRVHPGHSVLEMDAYTLHPYKLVRGLAEVADGIGVQIRERARVRRVAGTQVTLDGGHAVTAGKVVVCTNGYTPGLGLGERVRALVVHSFMTASAPLKRDAKRALVRDGDFTVEVNVAQAYHRMHGDRIIYGGIDKVLAPPGGDFAVPDRVHTSLLRHMEASFPGVAGIQIAHAWSGRFHATSTGLPIIRAGVTPGVILNVGYGGTGVALSLACAPLAASLATGASLTPDNTRLLANLQDTRISVGDAVRTVARMARNLAQPWLPQ